MNIKETISFTITNNTNSFVPVSILGNYGDLNDNSNATTSYQWNVTGFSVTTENTIILQYAPVGTTSFQTVVTNFGGTNYQDIVNALNTLNIGSFFLVVSGGNSYITIYSSQIAFNTLTIFNPAQATTIYYSANLNLAFDKFDIYKNLEIGRAHV